MVVENDVEQIAKEIETIDPVKTGKFIRRIRLELGMTQSDLAKDLFITRKAVSKWETGKCLPSIDIMKRLEKVLHASLEEIYAGEFKDKTKNIDKSSLLSRFIYSKGLKISMMVVIVMIIIGILISYNDKKTTVYSINTLSDKFYMVNGNIVKSGDSEIINFGNFSCDLLDTNENTEYKFSFYERSTEGEDKLILSYDYIPNKNNSIVNKTGFLTKKLLKENEDTDIYLKIEYYNVDNEYKSYDTDIIFKIIDNKKVKYEYSKYNPFELEEKENGKNEEVEVVSKESNEENYEIDLTFLYEMTEEELVDKYNKRKIIYANKTYKINTLDNSIKINNDKKRITINLQTNTIIIYNENPKAININNKKAIIDKENYHIITLLRDIKE